MIFKIQKVEHPLPKRPLSPVGEATYDDGDSPVEVLPEGEAEALNYSSGVWRVWRTEEPEPWSTIDTEYHDLDAADPRLERVWGAAQPVEAAVTALVHAGREFRIGQTGARWEVHVTPRPEQWPTGPQRVEILGHWQVTLAHDPEAHRELIASLRAQAAKIETCATCRPEEPKSPRLAELSQVADVARSEVSDWRRYLVALQRHRCVCPAPPPKTEPLAAPVAKPTRQPEPSAEQLAEIVLAALASTSATVQSNACKAIGAGTPPTPAKRRDALTKWLRRYNQSLKATPKRRGGFL